jgi:hypothetical protein
VSNLFEMGNWHLFWYLLIAAMIWRWRSLFHARVIALTLLCAFAFVFLGLVFFFSITSAWVADYGTVNRAVIHAVPAIAVFMLSLWLNPVEKRYTL